jgi:hypothetical protein
MTTRTTSRTIVFRRPFLLRGFDSEQPAGVYVIDTEEKLLESLSFGLEASRDYDSPRTESSD